MADKRSRKTVLEYDPLAWLKDEDNGAEEPKKKATGGEKSATKKAAKKAEQKSAVSDATVVKKTSKEAAAKSEEAKEEAVMVENIDFGFFDTEEEVADIKPVTTKSDGTVISLGSVLTLKTVAEFKRCFDESLTNNDDVTLDSTELQKIDTAGLQLLFSLQQSLDKTGQSLSWVSMNPIIESAANLIGLPDYFGNEKSASFGFFEDEAARDDQSQNQGFGFF